MNWLSRFRKGRSPELEPAFSLPVPDSFQAFFDQLSTMARNNTLEDGGHPNLVVVGTMDSVDGFAVNEYVDRGEDGRIELIEALWHRYAGKAEWFICVDESWEAKVPKGAEVRGFRASEQPDRKEVLLVRAVTKNRQRMWHSYVMCRDEEGRLVDLVDEEGSDLQIQDTLEAPLFGTRIERLAPVFDPTTR